MLPCNSLDRSEELVINSRLLRHWTDIVFNLKQVPELPLERESLGSDPLGSLHREKGSQTKSHGMFRQKSGWLR